MIHSAVRLYRNAYSGLSRRIWLLSFVMLINRSGTMVLAFMTLYCTHLGYSIEQAGWVVAIYGLGSVCGALAGGRISDAVGFYYTQVLSLFLGGLLFMLLGQMRTYGSICLCTFFLSMVNEAFRPANATAIAHYSTKQNRTQSFSLIRLAINIGWGMGSALGGILASINYHLLFWVDGFTNIAAAMMLLIVLPKVSLSEENLPAVSNEKTTPTKTAYKDKPFLFFWLFTLLFSICFFQMFTTVPIYFRENLRMDESTIGIVMAANGLIIAMFEMVIVFKLEGKIPYLRLMFYGTLLMAIAFLMLNLPIATGVVLAAVFMLGITIAEIVAMPFMNSYYISRATDKNRGQYAGLYTMAWSAAQVIGSSVGAFFAFRYGFNNLWFAVCLVSLLSAFGYLWLLKKYR